MKTEATPAPIFLKDYSQPEFWIPNVSLVFELGEEFTRVQSVLTLERNQTKTSGDHKQATTSLVLDGEGLKLLSIALDGRALNESEYTLTETHLTLHAMPEGQRTHQLTLETEIEPQKNLSCEGLYKSGGGFCTQCEAEAFRKITFFQDRPDVMAVFTVSIRADKTKYPVLLSNGNPVSRRDLPNGRHEVVWHDPFKKPSYLFALVAGDLGVLEDTFTTRSGRTVKLEIYSRKGLQERCRHAMDALKWSMKWDEDVYGLEYDLDIYMIVVAEDFNMGAMENKGLNVFNANYVLANPQTATDSDFEAITAVIAHEYFHNWTGNRVTCRDWFQLSLKEGLTVFRDQRFSSDVGSEAVKRIEEIIRLRTNQFAEDAGPMAHPVRPQSYISIDNFYTMTVYEKGAEVIRMIETILGRDGFRKGMDLYFKRHDGQAVTIEDFVAAMSDANHFDFTQFKIWYDQAGTPLLKVQTEYQPKEQIYTMIIEQSCAPTPGQNDKKPYHIPLAVGLIGRDGKDLEGTRLLHLRESKQKFTFKDVKEKPVLSLLRNFSAPVRIQYNWSDDELAFLMAHDSDAFSRWEAAQTLVIRSVKILVEDFENGRELRRVQKLAEAFGPILDGALRDPAFTSLMLTLPVEPYLAQFFTTVNVDAIHSVREFILREIAGAHASDLQKLFTDIAAGGTEGTGAKAAGLRALRSTLLNYLTLTDTPEVLALALDQLRRARNMTDELGALHAMNRSTRPERELALKEFYAKWKSEPLVMNKWLAIQATSPRPNVLDEVRRLAQDPVFDANNPNKIYSLYVAFGKVNLVRFHEKSGQAYRLIADQVMEIDSRNPQVAARLVSAFNQWRSFDSDRQKLIKAELSRILAKPDLSSNVFEIVSKTLSS